MKLSAKSEGPARPSRRDRARLAKGNSLIAGLAYFAIVFALGFVLGLVRVPFLVPRVGETTAVLIELPIILTLAWLTCRRLVSSLEVPPRTGSRWPPACLPSTSH